jgi:hypothetical protein
VGGGRTVWLILVGSLLITLAFVAIGIWLLVTNLGG